MDAHKTQSFFVLGETSLTAHCIEYLLERNHQISGLITDDPWLQEWAKNHKVPLYPSFNFLPEFDYLFSIVNPKIIPEKVIQAAKKLAVNYHDSPLPNYAGVHATSWAILNNEKMHGITWHVITEQIDAGDILKQPFFPIENRETTFSLNIKCFQQALGSFKDLIAELEEGCYRAKKQDLSNRSYFSTHKKPHLAGVIEWDKEAKEIETLFRSLDFGNYPNRFCLPKLFVNGVILFPSKIEILNHSLGNLPGTVIRVMDTQLQVATKTADVLLTIEKSELQKVVITAGDCLPLPHDSQKLADFYAELSRFESFWVNELLRSNYLNLRNYGLSSEKSFDESVNLPDGVSKETVLTAVLAYFYRITQQSFFTVSYESYLLSENPDVFRAFLAKDKPLNISFTLPDTLVSAQKKIGSLLRLVEEKKGFVQDLQLRYPLLRGLPVADSGIIVQFVDQIEDCHLSEKHTLGIFISEKEKKCRFISSVSWSFLHNAEAHLLNLLDKSKSHLPIAFLPILPESEEKLILSWSGNGVDSPCSRCIHEVIEAQSSVNPSAVALVCNGITLSYDELNTRAEALAIYLRSVGVDLETNVVICAEKSPELVIAILAVMKAGGAFVPLDPNYPKERLSYVLEDTRALLMLTQSHLVEKLGEVSVPLFFLDQPFEGKINAKNGTFYRPDQFNHRAYIIYTSGSTGRPKGVEIEHSQLAYAIQAKEVHYGLKNSKSLWVGSISFDVSIATILYPLVTGGTLYFSAEISDTDSDGIIRLLKQHEINHFCCAVSLYALILEQNKKFTCPSLIHVSVGGESLTESIALLHQKYFPQAVLFNEYGPTECTVWCSYLKVYDPDCLRKSRISIGRPIQHAKMYVLDEHLQVLPMGAKGEIYIGGPSVARGYLNNKNLTAERFIATSSFGRMFKTGDLGCWLPDGQIQFLGRVDHQVKFRGYRIELEEIEKTLANCEGIQQAVVCVKNDHKMLVAYLVLDSIFPFFSQESLRRQLGKLLPEYMIPSKIVVLDKFPLTANGKVDRIALPEPSMSRESDPNYKPPLSEDEQLIAQIWSLNLKVEKIGLSDNFFELGGNSLSAVQLIVSLQNAFKIEIPIKSLYEHPILEGFAQFLGTLRNSGNILSVESYPEIVSDPLNRSVEFPLTDIQQAYWLGRNEVFALSQIAVHGYSEYESEYLDLERLEKSWNLLIQRHEALRLIFPGDGKQKILSEVPFYSIHCLDLSNETEENTQAQLNALRARLSHQVLSLDTWPLFEICVTKLKSSYRLHFSIDGLIVDGWSFNILFSEWAKLYVDLGASLPVLEVSFRDYVLAEGKLKQSNLYHKDKEYWLSRLVDFPIGPPLPLSRHPKDVEKPNFSRCTKKLAKPLWDSLKEQIKAKGLTPTAFLLALFGEIIQIWSNSPRFTITLTLFNRLPLHSQINDIMGDFTSLTLCEIDNRGKGSFFERIQKVQAQLFSDLDHRLFSGIEVLRELSRQNQSSWDAPLMPVVFTSLLAEESQESKTDFTANQVYSITQTPQVWLDYKALNQSGDLVIEWDFVAELFPENLVEDMHQAYFNLLEKLAHSKTVWDQPYFELLPAHQKACRDRINTTNWAVQPSLLQELFHCKANEMPNQTAVIFEEDSLSYQELQLASYQLGRYLRLKGAIPNRLVAIVMDKGVEQVIACLGILTSGAAYLPISPDFPDERIAELLKLGEASIVLTQNKYVERLEALLLAQKLEGSLLTALDGPRASEWRRESGEHFQPVQSLDDLAYVIFTSGSTGIPKGVMIDHKGAVNTILDMNERFKVRRDDRVLAISNLNFDLSVYDIFGLLASGGTVVIPRSEDIKDPSRWTELLRIHRVTIWDSVPMFMSMLVEYLKGNGENLPFNTDLRLVLMSGDWIPLELPSSIKELFPRSEVISLGGATEASIWSIAFPITQLFPEWKSIPYGLPLRNQEMYILNEDLQPSPNWVPGDIYIGGIGVAKGYWKDKEKTDAQFIFHPIWKKKLYKTGDLGRYHSNGVIEFLGRSDNQVKINGYRIELGEIQKTLESHRDISHALISTMGEKDKEKKLIAYLVLNNNQAQEIQVAEVQDPLERMNFKLSKQNLRKFPKERENILLNLPETELSKFFNRKSYRTYDGKKLKSTVLSNILCESLKTYEVEGEINPKAIPIAKFESFLSSLAAHSLSEHLVPKYLYPSAGGLYPVQVYVRVKNISGIDPGLYYFHQIEKRLYPVGNELPDSNPAGHFSVYLVGKSHAIKPLYGDLWKEFCELEIGYISHLLNESALTQGIQLSMKHIEADEPITVLGASWIEFPQEHYSPIEIETFVYLKEDSLLDLSGGWYRFEADTKKFILVNGGIPFAPGLAATDYYSILMEAPFTFFLLSKERNHSKHVQAGVLAQQLMEHGIAELLGFCGIGTLDTIGDLQCKEVFGDRQLLHILAGGPITSAQLLDRESSVPKTPEIRLSDDLQLFLKGKLPDYFVPSSFIFLEQFPLSVNGKIDRKSLPLPQSRHCITKHYIPPRTDIEKKLANIWTEILKVENIGIQDHFFHLGGHSLSAVQVLSQLRKTFGIDFSIKKIFESPVLELLAAQIAQESEKTSQLIYSPIVKLSRSQQFPLSFTQQRLWFLDQLLDNKSVYNIPLAFKLKGSFSSEKLKGALINLITRHEILRTVFHSDMGVAKQVILDISFVDLPIFDLSQDHSLVVNHIKGEALTPFDLAKGPLMRGKLLKLEEGSHILLLALHHIITDERSIRILLREFSDAYNYLSSNQKPSHSSPDIQYVDFACWQRNWLKDAVLEKQLKFWEKELENCTDLLQLPLDKPRPQKPTHLGAVYTQVIPSGLVDLLRKSAQQEKATLFMLLLGVFQTFLHRYSGQADIITGFPVANRHYPDVENILGYFANTVVLRTIFNPESSFRKILSQIKDKATKIYENQDVPFEYLVDYLKVSRDLSRHPLFQVMFVYRQGNLSELELNDLKIEALPIESHAAKFDLTLTVEESSEEIKLEFEYAIDLFEKNTVQRMSENFLLLLRSTLANPDQQVGLLDLIAAQEYDKVVNQWNNTEHVFTPSLCIHQYFEAKAAQDPQHPALIFDDKIITYGELNKKSNGLANYLKNLNISADSIVGVALDRSLELVISIYSVLKAGGAYLPLELSYPKDRLDYMLKDAGVEVILTLQKDLDKFSGFKGKILLLDQLEINEDQENLDIDYQLSSLAYVIYTSGSTGLPKGVCIEHKGLTNRIAWMQNEYQLLPGDKVLQKTPYSFDVSVWEFFWPLAFGATLVIAKPDVHRNTEELIQTIQLHSITCLHFVPSMLGSFLELQGGRKCSSLRMVFASGEALSPHLVKQFFEQSSANLHNLYGPTEASIDVTYWDCHNYSLDSPIPIGKPIWNTETYILDKHLNPVPIGVAGELYLSGVGLARCYLNNPSLTKERFLQLPFKRDKRVYKTGDLVRYLPEGDIEFLGRLDHQVKVRGYRIELGEIENVLGGHAEISQCVVDVVIEKTGHKSLVAYITVRKPTEDAQLRHYLAERIPEYMIPSFFIIVDQFPLTTSGKIDRKALAQIEFVHHRNSRSIVLPRNELETDLAKIWKKVLQLQDISIADNFFELGGDSILSIQIIATAKGQGYPLQLADLFNFPTIEKLAAKLKNDEPKEATSEYTPFSLIGLRDQQLLNLDEVEDAYPLASLQAGMIYHNELNPHTAVYQDTFSYEMEGELNESLLFSILESKIATQPALKTSFNFDVYSEPVQLVHRKGNFNIEFKDISHLGLADQNEIIAEWFAQEKEKRFVLSTPTLIRFTVNKRSNLAFQLGFTFHHAILDGWSIATLVSDIIQEYEARIEGNPFSIRQPRLSYGAYIQHEKYVTNSPEQFDFWDRKLQGFQKLEIYNKFKRDSFEIDEYPDTRIIEKNIVDKLYELAKKLNVPLKSILLAAYLRVLSRVSGESDITTGYILNGRLEEFDSENTLGLFLNTVPLRLNLKGGTWEELIQAVYQEETQLLPFRWYPLAQIQNQFDGVEIFNTSFNYAHFHVYDQLKKNKHLRLISNKAYEKTNFIFSANFYTDALQGSLCLSLEHDSSKLSQKKLEEIFEYFENALKSLAYHSSSLYQHDSLLSEKGLNQLLNEWNDTENHSSKSSILDLFDEQVRNNPNHVAAIFAERSISYQKLDKLADNVAHFLRKFDHTDLIAISCERSIELVIGIMGILKAGKGFIPLDPNYPEDRLSHIFKNSNAQILVTQDHLHSKFEAFDGEIFEIEALLLNSSTMRDADVRASASDVAYALYTSGSTGLPKGVLVEHGALLNQIEWLQHTFHLTEFDKILHHSSLAFDVSIEEILWPLCSGATVVIGSKDIHQHIEGLINLIEKNRITILDLVPSLLDVILQHSRLERLQSIRQVLVGGEVLHGSLVKKFHEKLSASLHNMYGLTETTITSTYNPCSSDKALEAHSIGRPIWNTKTYILDKHLCPLPVGVPGEICISGRGLARGYLNQHELTNQRFVPNPFLKGTFLFRTGDLGYYLEDGSIDFLGRSDNQIKIRGQRVELGEIESILRKHPSIHQTIVELQEDENGNKQLISYIVLENTFSFDEEALKKWLRLWMPESWVPASFISLVELPLLPSGKIDRKAIPKIELIRKQRVLPRNTIEETLAKIWCEVLQVPEIGINENFFALGGNSLSLTIAAMHIRKKFEKNIPLRIFLENPTIANLANLLDERKKPRHFSLFEETVLPSSILPIPNQRASSSITHILLTGATGFLGAHLLFDLLESSQANIFCLIRAKNKEEAELRLVQNFKYYFPEAVFPQDRIIALAGDLGLYKLGLNERDYQRLAQKSDMIYHCGALVHHVYDYQTLISPNVLSVIEILKLAITGTLKKVVYISTLSIAETEQGEVHEELITGSMPSIISSGYEQTKWMAEKLLAEASDRGIPVQIFRPNTIIGHSMTGISSYENDHLLRLIKGCIQMEKAPAWDLKLDMLPVDFISKIITLISLNKKEEGKVFNLSNSNQIKWLDLMEWLKEFGYIIEIIPYNEWKFALASIDSENAIFPLLSLYMENEVFEEKIKEVKIDGRNTLAALTEAGIIMPSIDDHILHKTINYLSEFFFTKKPGVSV